MARHKWHKEAITFKEFVRPYIYNPATPFSLSHTLELSLEFEKILYEEYKEYLWRMYGEA